ncbi:MAG TPA: hypothetical protein VM694_25575 [Polyangium sp.]|nr:hypothetical protein [Polyangium sp.]
MSGCAGRTLAATNSEVSAQSVRVVVEDVDGDIIKLVVINESTKPMRIYRDRVTLMTPTKEQDRVPGGSDNLYTVEPGQSHKLYVRFDLSALEPNQSVELRMNKAVMVGDGPINFDPITLFVQ